MQISREDLKSMGFIDLNAQATYKCGECGGTGLKYSCHGKHSEEWSGSKDEIPIYDCPTCHGSRQRPLWAVKGKHNPDPHNEDECLDCETAFQDPVTYEPISCHGVCRRPLTWAEWYGILEEYAFSEKRLFWNYNNELCVMNHKGIEQTFTLPSGEKICMD